MRAMREAQADRRAPPRRAARPGALGAPSSSARPSSPPRCSSGSPQGDAPPGARDHPARPPRRARPAAAPRRPSPSARARSASRSSQPESVNAPDARALIAGALAGATAAGHGPGRRARRSCRVRLRRADQGAAAVRTRDPQRAPSLLPRWRGAAPVERAIMAGDERTGVSIMRLTAGLDSGPVCLAARGADRARRTTTARSPRACRRSAASCCCDALEQRSAVRRAARGGRHLRREDRARRQAARPRPPGRRAGARACGRCTRTSARACSWRTGALLGVHAAPPCCGRRLAGGADRAGVAGARGPAAARLLARRARAARGPAAGRRARWTPAPTCAVTRAPGRR